MCEPKPTGVFRGWEADGAVSAVAAALGCSWVHPGWEGGATCDWVVSTNVIQHDTPYATRYDAEWEQVMGVRHALLALLSEGPKYGSGPGSRKTTPGAT